MTTARSCQIPAEPHVSRLITAGKALSYAVLRSAPAERHRAGGRPTSLWQSDLMTASAGRSMAQIDIADLYHLAEIAAGVEEDMFARHPEGAGRYAGRLLCRALCQGAAARHVDRKSGVKDFDVWSFYAARRGSFPARWRGTADFGRPRFGRFPGDPQRYQGRRVDLLGRSLPVPLDAELGNALRGYLSAARTAAARALAAKAVVLIIPSNRAGEIIWRAIGTC